MHTRRSFVQLAHLLRLQPKCLADVSGRSAAKERPAVPKSPSDAYVDGVKFLTPEAPDYATARQVYNAWQLEPSQE